MAQKKKMGRPRKEIDMVKLAALCRMKPTLEDCAAFFECSGDIIEQRIRAEYDCTFSEFRDQKMVHTRFDLIRNAIRKSDQSDTMHIFCLKNLCNWRDKQPDEHDVVINNNARLDDDSLDQKIKDCFEELKKSDGSQ